MSETNETDVRSELSGVLGGAVLVSLGTLLSTGINVVARAVFARAYSPAAYGIFSLGFTLLLVLSMVATLGLRNGLPRQIAFDEADVENGDTDRAGTQILWALVLAGVVGTAVGAALVRFDTRIAVQAFNDAAYAPAIALVGLAVPLFALTRVVSAAFRGYSRPYERVVYQGLVRNVAFLLLLVPVVAWGLDHVAAIAMLPVSLAVTTVLYLVHLYRDNPGGFRDRVLDRLRDIEVPAALVRFSYPLMLSTLLLQLMTWMDILMLGYFTSSRVVGLYDGVRPLVRVIPIVWRGMIFMYVPLVSGLFARERWDAIRRVYFVLTKWFASATVPLVLVFVFFPASTLRAVFGPSFAVAAPALQLLAAAFCIGNLIGPTGATLTALGRTRVLFAMNLVAALLNFGLNVVLIPRIGLLGAAVGTTAALVVRNVLRLALLYHYGRIHALRAALFKPVAFTGGVAAGLAALLGPVSAVTLGALTVGLVVLFVGSVRLTDSVSPEDEVLTEYVTKRVRGVADFGR